MKLIQAMLPSTLQQLCKRKCLSEGEGPNHQERSMAMRAETVRVVWRQPWCVCGCDSINKWSVETVATTGWTDLKL